MANGMEGLFIGNAGLRTAQNGLNTTANNIANAQTTGYVRQQVVYKDIGYNFFASASISEQRMGLGASIGEIVHARDVFLDKAYRSEAGRQCYYTAIYNAIDEVQNLYQEIVGEQFSDCLTGDNSLWSAFEQLSEDPSDTINQNMVIQKSNLLLSRAQSIYQSLVSYQKEINTQIKDDVKRVNEIGKRIHELNLEIQAIEAGHVETAYDLRDERDMLLDELGGLVNCTYKESDTGIVSIKLEGEYFVDPVGVYSLATKLDLQTGYVDPYWPHLSNVENEDYKYLINFDIPVSTEYDTDIGEIKALIQARGTEVASFTDLDGVDPSEYAETTGMSVMEETEAQLDNLIHGITSKINDILCPNTTATFSVRSNNADGTYTVITYKNVKVLDTETANVGVDGEFPPRELFTRIGTDRYAKVIDTKGEVHYLYNEEDVYDCETITVKGNEYKVWVGAKGNGTIDSHTYNIDTGEEDKTLRKIDYPFEMWDSDETPKYIKRNLAGYTYFVLNDEYELNTDVQYTLRSLGVNDELENQVNLFPHITKSKEVDYSMGKKISDLWTSKSLTLRPGSSARFSFAEYYVEMTGYIATAGNTYNSTAETLQNSVTAIDNQRLQVTGVSTDEELTTMIKYQNAYNACSRYIQVISDMLDTLVSSLR
ncbi:MAG: flagellar hook-associated protein FlgK [Lachnospiraceae bacterium]|nr:flagellar hook-associated protein FlgK [Lachnospiraceae bacterium]